MSTVNSFFINSKRMRENSAGCNDTALNKKNTLAIFVTAQYTAAFIAALRRARHFDSSIEKVRN